MKNLIWVVVAALVLGGGYTLYSNNVAEKVAMAQAEADKAAAAAAAAEEEAASTAAAAEEAAAAAKAEAEATAAAAAEAAETAATEATETATAVAEEATAATEEAAGGLADLLTREGFNFDKVAEMIDGSELGMLQKTGLKTVLSSAQDNPELLSDVLAQIKSALGM